jgi:hypothetical protein
MRSVIFQECLSGIGAYSIWAYENFETSPMLLGYSDGADKIEYDINGKAIKNPERVSVVKYKIHIEIWERDNTTGE